ncbi:hypothetical protein [Chromobacterium violaceum]|uniref:hypothetical protein n=1 Tax=Chromobacterium violaceum TaxID=536 RepID=UPI0015942153|nr:hypothetical protein [Chromobacterium violaceum]
MRTVSPFPSRRQAGKPAPAPSRRWRHWLGLAIFCAGSLLWLHHGVEQASRPAAASAAR